LKAGGLNAVDLYVQWSLHNPEDGVYNWDGIADIENIVQIAHEEDLLVILRPGPYICSELDNGGLPYWLASKYPDIKVRTQDPDYLFEVERWYSHLMPQLEKHWYGNGGNIIMVQVENEYGAFYACDNVYKEFLRDQTLKYTKDNAILFTVDRPIGDELKCGQVKDVFVTTDFGLYNYSMVVYNFNKLREVQPNGPLVNTEFYTGWLTHWQEANARRGAADLAKTLEYMLVLGANVDFYMYFGGTNFGFWAGANDWGIGKYMADITSYDYDAPMDEAGNPTEKYMIFRNVIKKYIDVVPESDIPERIKTMQMDAITLRPVNSILSPEGRQILGSKPIISNMLLTFEQLKQFSGFVLYETTLPKFTRDPAVLQITDLRDRAQVYIDGEFVGTLSRENVINTLPISANYGTKLSILVENQGRINFQIADDYKGILGSVRISDFHSTTQTYTTLNDWTITGYPFEKFVELEHLARVSQNFTIDSTGIAVEGPIVFHAEFILDENREIYDTYWDTSDWNKGFIFVNGFNLGRYWSVGPQMTIFIPKDILKHGKNEVYVVELQHAPINFKMNFLAGPIFINDEKV
jgi:beta-galactosidase